MNIIADIFAGAMLDSFVCGEMRGGPRARHKQVQFRGTLTEYYRLGDETHSTVLTACTKCEWKAAFNRDELIAAHGADYPLPDLLQHFAAPGCSRVGSYWDRCGVHYVDPIEGSRRPNANARPLRPDGSNNRRPPGGLETLSPASDIGRFNSQKAELRG
jgi:hypothetical protein